MIHAHHFRFVDQPQLQREYERFGFELHNALAQHVIDVKENDGSRGFGQRSPLRYMSNRLCYYLSEYGLEHVGVEDDWGLEVEGVLSLAWDSRKRTIYYGKAEKFTPDLLYFWILHTFFPIVLEMEKSFKMMHAGCVAIGDAPVLLCAPAFGGKSTLTDYFVQQGHTLYADDTLPIKRDDGGRYMVYPAFPYHRPYREPESLGYRAERFARHPAPLHALFDLHPVAPDRAVTIRTLTGIARFKAFFYSGFIKFPFMKQHRFEYFTQMASVVPVYKVEVPWDKKRLPEVYERITAWVQNAHIGEV